MSGLGFTFGGKLISLAVCGVLVGCSIRPTLVNVPKNLVSKKLQSKGFDPTFRIVHRIRCETRHAIAAVTMEFLRKEFFELAGLEDQGNLKLGEIAAIKRLKNKNGTPTFEDLVKPVNYDRNKGEFASDLTNILPLQTDLLNLAAFANIKIGYGFSFTLTEANDSNKGILNFNRIFDKGTKQIGLSGNYTRKRVSKRTFSIVESIKDLVFDLDLMENECNEKRYSENSNWHYPIYGSINIKDSISAFANLSLRHQIGGKIASGLTASQFSDLITFTTTLSGGINPSITLAPTSPGFHFLSGSVGLSNTRTDEHQLNLVLSATDSIQEVLNKIRNDQFLNNSIVPVTN